MIGFFCVRICRRAASCFRFAALSAALFAAPRSRASRSLASRRLAIAPSAGYVSQSASLKHSIKRTRPYYVDVRKRGSRLPPFPLSAVPLVFRPSATSSLLFSALRSALSDLSDVLFGKRKSGPRIARGPLGQKLGCYPISPSQGSAGRQEPGWHRSRSTERAIRNGSRCS